MTATSDRPDALAFSQDLPQLRLEVVRAAYEQGRLTPLEASLLSGKSLPTVQAWRQDSRHVNGAGAASTERLEAVAVPAERPLISVVLPIYNEEANIPTLWARLAPILRALGTYEVVFVNDGSRDRSAAMILELQAEDPAVKLVNFSRNFGHQAALCAGIDHTTGQAVVMMDADLQDPPELLEEFIKVWKEGTEVVYAVRQKRKEGVLKRLAYHTFYRLLGAISTIKIPLDAGDFCLMDRKVVDAVRQLPERNRFLRGLRCWVGYRHRAVIYERPARHAGETKYTLQKLVKLALDGLLSFSSFPLRLSAYLGFVAAALGLVYLFFALAARVFFSQTPEGWTSLICITLLLGGIQLVMMGVLGEYLARVYEEAKQRPMYVVAEFLSRSAGNPVSAGPAETA